MLRPAKVFWTSVRQGHGVGKYSNVHCYPREIRPDAKVSKLVPRLRVKINPEPKKLSQPEGPEGRLKLLRQTVTAVFKYERIEATYNRTHEAQGYVERIISEAIRHGDCHIPTMEMADYWLLEKQLIHKLFKVLVPRFEHSTRSYTRFFTAPRPYFGDGFYKPQKDLHIDPDFSHIVRRSRAVLELRGNPYPPLLIPQVVNPRSLHNILLWAAREEKRKELVEESFTGEGLLGKSEHLQKVLARSATRLQNRNLLGEEKDQLSESIERESRAASSTDTTDMKSALQGVDVSDKSSESSEKQVHKNDSQSEKSPEPNKT